MIAVSLNISRTRMLWLLIFFLKKGRQKIRRIILIEERFIKKRTCTQGPAADHTAGITTQC
jgi:hypothetical protein